MLRNINILIFISLLNLSVAKVNCQESYWVSFTDKQDVTFDPYEYFSLKTIEKRLKLGIPLVQFTDLPVNPSYKNQVNSISEVKGESRWMNAVLVKLNAKEIEQINSLAFVKEVNKVAANWGLAEESEMVIDEEYYELLSQQLEAFEGQEFMSRGINGKGVRIAVLDIGFNGVDTLEVFSRIREEGRIIATYDFVQKEENVFHYASHGTTVLGCIAGSLDSIQFGLGTGAEFLLARTEINKEVFKEEENWVSAMEWADKNGADIISSSLGYTSDRYFPDQMDGKTVYISRMANIAASKGMLVVNAAGNEGDGDWEVIGAPADADSVLSVGGIDAKGVHIDFSSFGPTADGRMKPNVVAFGQVISVSKNDIKKGYGTSYAAPLVTGFAACVMQLHPEWDNMRVFEEIQKSGHLYPYFDYAHGYGVPQANYFLEEMNSVGETFSYKKHKNNIEIFLNKPDSDESTKEIENNCNKMFRSYLYYHIANPTTNKIRKYTVVKVEEVDGISISLDDLRKGEVIRIYYNGFTDEINFD